jgi:hypothetical protein
MTGKTLYSSRLAAEWTGRAMSFGVSGCAASGAFSHYVPHYTGSSEHGEAHRWPSSPKTPRVEWNTYERGFGLSTEELPLGDGRAVVHHFANSDLSFPFKEKSMHSFIKWMIAVALMTSVTAQAATVESGCLTVTGVVNAESANAVILALSPAISGCSPNSTPGVEFAVGVNGVTAATLNSILASGLAAALGGRQVQVLYDDSASNCFGLQIANGGFVGQCP